jgi:hypothetical protein
MTQDAKTFPILTGDDFADVEKIASIDTLFRKRADELSFEEKAKVNSVLQAFESAIRKRRSQTRDLLEMAMRKALEDNDYEAIQNYDISDAGDKSTRVLIPGVYLSITVGGGEKVANAEKTIEVLKARNIAQDKIDKVVTPVAHKINVRKLITDMKGGDIEIEGIDHDAEVEIPEWIANLGKRPDTLEAMRLGRFLAEHDVDFEEYVEPSKYEVDESLLSALSFSDVLTDEELAECYDTTKVSRSVTCNLDGKLKSRVVTELTADTDK